jgi:hypothetical protein
MILLLAEGVGDDLVDGERRPPFLVRRGQSLVVGSECRRDARALLPFDGLGGQQVAMLDQRLGARL